MLSRRIPHSFATICLFLFSTFAAIAQERPSFLEPKGATKEKFVANRVLVRFRQNTKASRVSAAHAALRAKPLKKFKAISDLQLVELPADLTVHEGLRKYRRNRDVLYAEPDYRVYPHDVIPNDPSFSLTWGLRNLGIENGVAGADIGATQAWELTTGSKDVEVGIIDSGVNISHPDLADNSVPGFNAATDDPTDYVGHGTHVAGTIGGRGNNGIGVAGVNWQITMVPCKFLTLAGGSTSDAIECLDYIASLKDAGHNIIATNNSWGGGNYSQALKDAIAGQLQRGILFIASAGNGGFDGESDDNDIFGQYPASYDLPNIIVVAASNRADQLAHFSNFGKRSVHLSAPGVSVFSTRFNDYDYLSGTSMAAPHVTGAAALLKAYQPGLDWRQIKNLLLSSAERVPALSDTVSGGRLNVFAAMTCSNRPLGTRLMPHADVVTTAVGRPLLFRYLNINCAQPAGVPAVQVTPGDLSLQFQDDGSAPDQATGDGVYSATWTPTEVGSYSVTFPGGDVVTVHVLQPYQYTTSSGNYRQISGTSLNLIDEETRRINLPFPIKFGGNSFDHIFVSDNGIITFDDGFNFPISYPLPFPLTNAIVAPWWQDLAPLYPGNRNVFWAVNGAAPSRELVVEWRDVPPYPFLDNGGIKFQVVFSESSDDVYFNYDDTSFGSSAYFEDQGAIASTGIQVGASEGTSFSFFSPSIPSGLSIHWTLGDPDFDLSLDTASATAFPSDAVTIKGKLKALRGWKPAITLTCNDENGSPACDPLSLTPTDGGTAFYLPVFSQAVGGHTIHVQASFINPNITHTKDFALSVTDFSVIVQSTPVRVLDGMKETTLVQLTAMRPLPGPVTLACAGLPPGTSCIIQPSFPAVVTPDGPTYVSLTVAAAPGSPIGSKTAQLVASSPGLSTPKTTDFSVEVQSNPSFYLQLDRSDIVSDRTTTTPLNITVQSQDGFAGTVNLGCVVVPAGPTCALSSSSVNAFPAQVQLTVLHNGAAPGNYSVNLTASSPVTQQFQLVPYRLADYEIAGPTSMTFYPLQYPFVPTVTVRGLNGFSGEILASCDLSTIPGAQCSIDQRVFVGSSPQYIPVFLNIPNSSSSGGVFPLIIRTSTAVGGPVRVTTMNLTVKGFTLELGSTTEHTAMVGTTTGAFDLIFKPYGGFDLPVDFEIWGGCFACSIATNKHLDAGAPETNLNLRFALDLKAGGGDYQMLISAPVKAAFADNTSGQLFTNFSNGPLMLHVQDYHLEGPEQVALPPGGSTSFAVKAVAKNGFSAPINISCPPALSIGLTCNVDKSQMLPGDVATFTFHAATNTLLGFRNVSFNSSATKDGITIPRSYTTRMFVGTYSLSVEPASLSIPAGGTATYFLTAPSGSLAFGSFQGVVECLDLPVGVTCDHPYHMSVPGSDGYAQLQATPGVAQPGEYTIRFTVAANGEIQTATAKLVIEGNSSLVLQSPNGFELWNSGPHDVVWSYTGNPGSTVRLELWNRGVFDRVIATGVPIGTDGRGFYTWNVAAKMPFSQYYQVKVISEANPAITDVSDYRIWMGWGVDFVYLKGGETFFIDNNYGVIFVDYTWAAYSEVRLDLYKGGVFYANVGDEFSGYFAFGNYQWTIVPNLPLNLPAGSDYSFRIYPAADPTRFNSTGNFTIARGSFQLLDPKEGEVWVPGSTHTIRWMWTGSPVKAADDIAINLRNSSSGDTYTITPATPIGDSGTGTFQWTVPPDLRSSKNYTISLALNTSTYIPWGSQTRSLVIGNFRTVTVTKPAGGTIESLWDPEGVIRCGESSFDVCSNSFPVGYALTFRATPFAGYVFTGWTGACNGTSITCAVTVSGDIALGANFKVDPNYDFTVNAPTATATVSRGGTAEYSVVFAPVANMTTPLYFGCTGLPAGFSCSFDKSGISPGTQPVTVKVRVAIPSFIATINDRTRPFSVGWLAAPLVGIILASRRNYLRRLLLVLCAGLLLISCGGGGGSSSVGSPTPTGGSSQTPKTYTFNVVGNSGAVQRSIPLTLNVQ